MVPVGEEDLIARLEDAGQRLRALDWQVHDIVIMPVASLAEGAPGEGSEVRAPASARP